ncbi:MAG: ABC transporter permease [Arenicella sp.]
MVAYILRRIGPSILTMLSMAIIVFIGVFYIGDPIEMLVNVDADEQTRAKVAASLGLDLPMHEQFWQFLKNLIKGDLGDSFVHNEPALQVILDRMPATMELAICAVLLAIVFGIPLGIWSGLRPDSFSGKLIMSGSILGFSLPTFWVGLMFILVFSVQLGWLPASGRGEVSYILGIPVSFLSWEGMSHLILPALNLGLLKVALVIRLARAGTSEVVQQDFIKFARAKGVSQSRLILVHLLKNIMIPVVTVLGIEFGSLIAFAVITETIFSWPGMGKLLIESIVQLDRPVIVAYLLLVTFIFIVINLLVDVLYSALDPRVRLGGKS